MVKNCVAALCAVLLLGVTAGAVSAHASLQTCSIKNNQVFHAVGAPHMVTATFAEPLDPKFSWMKVFEGQADHGLVTEKQNSVVSFKNPKVMTLKLPKLQPEKYYLIWYTHSAADGHFAAGIVYFQVVK
ncbi:MAG: copper resistance protein CopC [Chloroflexi bacterium]|nr:copper resistance protein CopC [Chloroflexota bacterium]